MRAYHETYGLDCTVTNCSNNYGPYQFPEKLIPLTIVNILLGKPLPVYGDGLHARDWLHVHDHCAATPRAGAGRSGEVLNIGGNSESANIDIVRALCGLVEQSFGRNGGLRSAFPASPAGHAGRAADLITHVRDRPGRARPALRHRFHQGQNELGYAPAYDGRGA